jgi:hypothetical protein
MSGFFTSSLERTAFAADGGVASAPWCTGSGALHTPRAVRAAPERVIAR